MGQKVTITKMRIRKGQAVKGYHVCPSCHGTGVKKNTGRKPKKS